MDIDALRQQIANMRQSLIHEEILDSQFIQLERLQGTQNPNFVEEMVTTYFDDSPAVIAKIDQGLDQGPALVDRAKLNSQLNRFAGLCVSIGANKVKIEACKAIQCCSEDDMLLCRAFVETMKEEYHNLKSRLQAYFELIHQLDARIAETSNPPK